MKKIATALATLLLVSSAHATRFVVTTNDNFIMRESGGYGGTVSDAELKALYQKARAQALLACVDKTGSSDKCVHVITAVTRIHHSMVQSYQNTLRVTVQSIFDTK